MLHEKLTPSLAINKNQCTSPRKSYSTEADVLYLKPIFASDENETANQTDVFTRLYRTQTKSSHIRFQNSNVKQIGNKNQIKNRSKSMSNLGNVILPKIEINHNQISWNNLTTYFNPSSEFFDKLLQPTAKDKNFYEELDYSKKIWKWLSYSEAHLSQPLK